MKTRKLLLTILTLCMVFSVGGLVLAPAAAANPMKVTSVSVDGGLGSDFHINWQDNGNAVNLSGLHRNTKTAFPDFFNNLEIKKGSAKFKTLDKFSSGSVNFRSQIMDMHGFSLGEGDLVRFNAGFRYLTADKDYYGGGDVSADVLRYSTEPLETAIEIERLADGKFTVVGENPIGIKVDASFTLMTGETQALNARTIPANAANNTLIYASDNTDVATVSELGVVTAVGAGTASVTVSAAGGLTREVSFIVTAGVVDAESVTIDPSSVTLNIGQVQKIIATVNPADTTDKTLIYTSLDSTVAEVKDGSILAKKEGSTIVEVTAHNGVKAQMTVTVNAGRDDVKVSKHEASFGNGNSKAFSFDFTDRKDHNINNLRGRVDGYGNKINDYILINGQTLDKTSADFHFWSGELYMNAFTPKAGDTIELKAGFPFTYVVQTQPFSGTVVFKDTLAENYKVIYTSGAWAKVADAGSVNRLTQLGAVERVAGGAIDVERLEIKASFEIPLVDGATAGLESVDSYADNIFIDGMSLKAINQTYTAEHPDEGTVPVVLASANGITLTLRIAAEVLDNGTPLALISETSNIELKISQNFVSTTGMILDAEILRYYVPEVDFWSTIQPYTITKASDVYVANVKYSVIDGGVNGCLDITFNADIATSTILGYGGHPRYLNTDNIPPVYQAKALVNQLTSSGAMNEVFTKIKINGKSITQFWIDEEISSYQAMFERFQIHITSSKVLSIRTHNSSTLGENSDFTLYLPKGFTFYHGAVLNADVTFTYTAATKTVTMEYGIALDVAADKTAVNVGDSAQITTGLPTDNVLPVEFISSNENVATVDSNGVVTALSAGTVTITVNIGGKSQDIILTVVVETESITVKDSEVTLNVGETADIEVTVLPVEATDIITYASSDDSVATVDSNGKITAMGEGTATITVTSGSMSATVTVTVEVNVESIVVEESEVSLTEGETSDIQVTVLPEGATAPITYSSSDESVATVDANGKITAVSEGTATITITSGGKNATVTVSVTAAKAAPRSCNASLLNGTAWALTAFLMIAAAIITLKNKRAKQ